MSTIAVMAVFSSHCVCAKSATEWRYRLWPSEIDQANWSGTRNKRC